MKKFLLPLFFLSAFHVTAVTAKQDDLAKKEEVLKHELMSNPDVTCKEKGFAQDTKEYFKCRMDLLELGAGVSKESNIRKATSDKVNSSPQKIGIQPSYLFFIRYSKERPTPEQALDQQVKINPKLIDINGNQKIIHWSGVNSKTSTDKVTAEVRQTIGEEIKSIYKDFYLSQSGFFSSIGFNVLIKQNGVQPASASLLDDWLPEEDLRVKQSKQAILASLLKFAPQIKKTDKEFIVTVIVNNAGYVSDMASYEFTGFCGRLVTANLLRKNKSMEVEFDFSINLDGTIRLLKRAILVGDAEVAEAFDKWVGGCLFNTDYFAGKIYRSNRVKVEFK